MAMGIAEKIKSEGRARKTSSAAPPSDLGTPVPTPAKKSNSPGPPPPPKADKPKKKGTASALPRKKPGPKPKPKLEGMSRSQFYGVAALILHIKETTTCLHPIAQAKPLAQETEAREHLRGSLAMLESTAFVEVLMITA